jgi:hypothetical protein
MDAKRWERIKQVFSSVIACGPDRASARLLSECESDDELLRELRPLVEEHFRLVNAGEATVGVDASKVTSEPDLPSLLAGRFRVIARLGSGSFGDVYRVIDEAGDCEQLALKILRSSDPLALHYFKREFRSLADVYHRNIVALRELIAHGDRWMFSMEFVDGLDLLRFLDSHAGQDRDGALRSCITQLAEGLQALHERNLLHRDLKPSNVIVTASGRLVLLDFGLVRPFGDDVRQAVTFAGTPDYMSPEQAVGAALGEPSDWYSLGVMLYQALTGKLPFHFDSFEALRRKQIERPVPPSDISAKVPAELNELCLKLLEPDPLQRGSYTDVVRLAYAAGTGSAVRESPAGLFVGREKPLRGLHDSYTMAEDRPVLVHLCGASGVGKTVLLREFVRRLGDEPSTLVFYGRCYEGESVPFQAIDDLIDHIGQYLAGLPQDRVGQFLPRNFAVLVKMFPVLSRFLTGQTARAQNLESVDLRIRAFGALREMLGRFAERARVVLVVDDLQWGDADGCAALSDLLSSSDSPPILVVLAYRSEDIEASPWLKAFRETTGQPSSRQTVFIDLDRLDKAEAAELAASLLARDASPASLQHVIEQSGGNPFLLHEIVRWVKAPGVSPGLTEAFSLADVVRSRVNDLRPESRHILELVAVAGQPTELSILQTAAGITDAFDARDELVAARFIRLRTARDDGIEVYHDRIRTTLVADMDAVILVERNRELAFALVAANRRDPERIAAHFEQAHELHLCATFALQAARRAVEVLAFNKAGSFFEMALAAQTLGAADLRAARRECADAFANAGLGLRASEHYLAAGEGATMDERLECNLLAAEQLLYSGHVDRGLAIFGTVLGQVGLKLPNALSRIPLDLLLRRAHLKIRGLHWREKAAANVPRNILLKIDTCSSVATGLSLVDVARGAALQTTSLLLALRAGEPSRIARALAMEAGYTSTAGVKAESRAERLLAVASDLSTRTGDHRAIGLTAAMSAGCAWNAGRWAECYRRAHSAREQLRELHERVMWERDTASIFEMEALRWMGRWSEMKSTLPVLLEDARLRGDLYAQAILQMHAGTCVELANDNPSQARAGLTILERWSNTGFHVEHLVEMHNQVEIALYMGNGGEAISLVRKRWQALEASLLLRVQTLNLQMRSIRARSVVCAALEERSSEKRRDLLHLAERECRAIRLQGAPWGAVLAGFIEAGSESLLGKSERAIGTLRRTEIAADTTGMLMHSAVARRSLGLLMGGDAGRQLVASGDAILREEGVTNPERLAAVIAPGVQSV